MTLRSSLTKVGAVAFDGLDELFGSAANNHFDDNTYRVPDTSGACWFWAARYSRGASGRPWDKTRMVRKLSSLELEMDSLAQYGLGAPGMV
jgi:hypothetical protein